MSRSFLDRTAFTLLLLLIVFCPLVLGSNRVLLWIVNFAVVWAVFLLWSTARINWSYQGPPISQLVFPFLCLGSVLLWISIQLVPSDFAGLSNPIWNYSEVLLQEELDGRMTANPLLSKLTLLRLTTYVVFAWLVIQFAKEASSAYVMLLAVTYSATAYAIYGAMALASGDPNILWFGPRFDTTNLTATFVNRNSAATYFGISAITATTLLYARVRKLFQTSSTSEPFLHLLEKLVSLKTASLLGPVIILWGAVFLTNSRAGIASSLIALLLFLLLCLGPFSISRKRRSRCVSASSILVVLVVAGVIGLLLVQSGNAIGLRLIQQGVTDSYRLQLYQTVLQIIGDYPLQGVGAGAFPTMLMLYPTSELPAELTWDKSHNSYLEAIVGLGIPASIILFAAFIWSFSRCVSGLYSRRVRKLYPSIGICSSTVVVIHSTVDFSIEIQAVALVYIVMLCVGVAQSLSARNSRAGSSVRG